eukprot:CAMPEP_0203680962 /NCGR_PEP_ID=MMETSP0090-20130426/41240_1 /ASSEMBLY_ACC=CAM_ASM_001088 /TAXON_ID=426623 /ORGANISM="Chaetoceros affinis, Strain CCMP159" /LENGTH=267 /DNA_ID=CAMNT_0050549269 /DNA_START=18 /DNA_END=818 /DNA_ORIENTATION=-
MGNDFSSPKENDGYRDKRKSSTNGNDNDNNSNDSNGSDNNNTIGTGSGGYKEFLASAGKTIGEASGIVCGSLDDVDDDNGNDKGGRRGKKSKKRGLAKNINLAMGEDLLCGAGGSTGHGHHQYSPSNNTNNSTSNSTTHTFQNPDDDSSLQSNPMSALFARALLNEVTDNPATMTPVDMAAREKKLIRAQEAARNASKNNLRAVGGQGSMNMNMSMNIGSMGSMSNMNAYTLGQNSSSRIVTGAAPPTMLSENRAQVQGIRSRSNGG